MEMYFIVLEESRIGLDYYNRDFRKIFDVLWNFFICDGFLIFIFVVDKMKGKGYVVGILLF